MINKDLHDILHVLMRGTACIYAWTCMYLCVESADSQQNVACTYAWKKNGSLSQIETVDVV